MIYKKFFGKFLVADIDSNVEEKVGEYVKTGDSKILQKKDEAIRNSGYRLATVLQVGDELEDKFSAGDRIQILAVGREKRYVMDGTEYWVLPVQDVIGVV